MTPTWRSAKRRGDRTMYYHNRSPQADEEDNDDEQQRREEEMDDATDRLADVMEACGAPRSEAVKAAKGKVRHAQ